MTIMNDLEVAAACSGPDAMITPFLGRQLRGTAEAPLISFGLSSFGYDVRVADGFRLAIDARYRPDVVLDPKSLDEDLFPVDQRRRRDGAYIIPARGFVLCRTVEQMNIPGDVMVVAVGKSTWARLGLICNVTPLEPGWNGRVTLELSNTTDMPIAIYPNEGICQFLFFRGSRPRVTYADRGGKYQGQQEITLAKA